MCHHRRVNIKHPRPVHMERRILEAITQPIYPQQLSDPGKLCSVIENEKWKSPDLEEATIQVGICTVMDPGAAQCSIFGSARNFFGSLSRLEPKITAQQQSCTQS